MSKERQNSEGLPFYIIIPLLFASASSLALNSLDRHKTRELDVSTQPRVYDVNSDGVDDIVLQRRNEGELVLYGTVSGDYVFENPVREKTNP